MGASGRRRVEVEQDVLEAGRLIGRAALIYHTKIGAILGLGPTDMKALDILESSGPLSPSELAARLRFAPASVTGLLDRLQRRDLVRRVPHPQDGRRLLIELNAAAVDRFKPIYTPLSDALGEVMANYTVTELDLIATVLREMAEEQLRVSEEMGDPPLADAK
jgi:DNA-binding MarR family transcriptional regulator